MIPSPQTLPLRDIHLPEPVSWWPPAPGWWFLLGLVGLVLLAAFFAHRRRRSSASVRVAAFRALDAIQREYQRHRSAPRLASDLSALMRRACLTLYPREQVASLTGEAWLSLLDRTLPGGGFSRGAGRILSDGPYRPAVDVDIDELLALCRRWISHLPADHGR